MSIICSLSPSFFILYVAANERNPTCHTKEYKKKEGERITIEVRVREIVVLHSLFSKLFFLIDRLNFNKKKKENDDGKTTSFIFCR
jgi:hypothetical protein